MHKKCSHHQKRFHKVKLKFSFDTSLTNAYIKQTQIYSCSIYTYVCCMHHLTCVWNEKFGTGIRFCPLCFLIDVCPTIYVIQNDVLNVHFDLSSLRKFSGQRQYSIANENSRQQFRTDPSAQHVTSYMCA